jgi:hypothetical protein
MKNRHLTSSDLDAALQVDEGHIETILDADLEHGIGVDVCGRKK